MRRLLLASDQVVVSRFLSHTGCLKSPYQPGGETAPTDVIDRDKLSPIERTMIAQTVREITAIQRAKHETIQLTGGRIIGIDPGHSDTPTTPWRALELIDAIATVR